MRTLLAAAVAVAGLAYARLAGGPLDGTSWEVKLKPDSFFSLSSRGTLAFERGRLSTWAGSPLDASQRYSSTRQAEGLLFSAASVTAGSGTLTWQGVARGDRIEGLAVRLGADGSRRVYSFKGRRRGG